MVALRHAAVQWLYSNRSKALWIDFSSRTTQRCCSALICENLSIKWIVIITTAIDYLFIPWSHFVSTPSFQRAKSSDDSTGYLYWEGTLNITARIGKPEEWQLIRRRPTTLTTASRCRYRHTPYSWLFINVQPDLDITYEFPRAQC